MPLDHATWESLLAAAGSEIRAYRESLDDGPPFPKVRADHIRAHLSDRFPFTQPVGSDELIQSVSAMLHEWGLHTPHPRYFGLFNPDVVPITVAADALAAAFNPQMAAWSHHPAACEIENHTLAFFQALLGHEPVAGAASFACGGMEANHQGVIVALTHCFPGFAESGARGIEGRPTLYVSEEAHHSFVKVAHACGIGRESVRRIEADGRFRMNLDAVAEAIARDAGAGHKPFLVVATAGTTGSGAIDPLPEIAEVCRRNGLWMHCDAAWAGGALMSERLRGHLAGIEQADSVTWDAHKWLSVPMGAGMFFCKRPEAVLKSFSVQTGYMPAKEDSPDPYSVSLQWSRRFIGLKVFMALANLGREGYARLIEHQAAMGDVLRSELAKAGWKIINDTPLPVACFTRDELDAPGAHAEFLTRVYARRESWISRVNLAGGKEAMRACITNFRTTEADIAKLVETLDATLRG
jgi:glutamate/tyrosine decarboxylase-like PLP-dependent enzyme